MAIPAGYTQHQSGFFFYSDGSGPYGVTTAGVVYPISSVNIAAGLTGALTRYNRLAGGAIANWYNLTADGLPTGWVGGGVVYGIRCLTNGTIAGLYDSASAAGTNMVPALALVANQKESLGDVGVGIAFTTSPFFDITGGTYLVFGVPDAL